jgi:hypothetical protein
MKLRGTRVQYGFLLHRNCFLLINMLENFIKFENHKIKKKKNLKFKFFLTNLKISIFSFKIQNFHKISKLSKISYYFKKIQNDKIFKNFQKFHSFHKISKLRVK